jgi:RNA polymerase sigma factor (TIGR02999 family)
MHGMADAPTDPDFDGAPEELTAGSGAHELRGLLRAWAAGDPIAGDQVFSLAYQELRAVARRQRRRWGADDTLETTAILHEAYLRLRNAPAIEVADRQHLRALMARIARQVISNYSRRVQTAKRGAGGVAFSLEAVPLAAPSVDEDAALDHAVLIDRALSELSVLQPRAARIVECRFYGGLSIPETAAVVGVSEATVKRDWLTAQAWLQRALAVLRDGDA